MPDSVLERKRKFEIKREALQMEAAADISLSRNQLAVYVVLTAKYWNRESGTAFPSIRTLAGLCGCSKSAVWRAIQGLIHRGYLFPQGRRGSVVYEIRAPLLSLPEGDTCPAIGGTALSRVYEGQNLLSEPLNKPLIEPLSNLKEVKGKREQEARPPKQDRSAPVSIETPEQKARIEKMRQVFHRTTEANRMPWAPVPRRDDAHRNNRFLKDDLARRKYLNEHR